MYYSEILGCKSTSCLTINPPLTAIANSSTSSKYYTFSPKYTESKNGSLRCGDRDVMWELVYDIQLLYGQLVDFVQHIDGRNISPIALDRESEKEYQKQNDFRCLNRS